MILTTQEVLLYSGISATAQTIIDKNMIPIVQERVVLITNNFFDLDLCVQSFVTFDGSAGTIVASLSFSENGFYDGDDIIVSGSYRNDGYHTIETVDDKTLYLVSGSTIVAEPGNRTVEINVVKWPVGVKQIAAQMIEYDCDVRPKRKEGLRSRALGPFSESYGKETFGYPDWIIDKLSNYSRGRLV